MTGGAHLSAGHGEGRRWREVRHFPVKEAAIGHGFTDARPAGPAERPRPSGERESGRLGEGKRKWVAARPKTGAGPNSSNKTFLNFYLEFEFFATLEICTRRFRRNFDIGIFPKIFWAFLGFLEIKTNGM
jgi:hypothetical protein